MSLLTDKAFYNALHSSRLIWRLTDGRVYSTAVPVPEDQLDNTPLPYIIITFDGMTNSGVTKDCSYEGSTDIVNVGITAVAESRHKLGELMEAIRAKVQDFFDNADEQTEDFELIPYSYELTAGEVGFDSIVPCYYQKLNYQCDTTP